MSISNWFGIGKAIAEPINSVSNLYTTDKARIEAETKFEEVAQKPVLAQLSNNTIMASSSRLFNSGWQPLMGWTAGFCIALFYIPQLVVATYIWAVQCLAAMQVYSFPIAPDNLLNLVYLLFGFGIHSIANKVISK